MAEDKKHNISDLLWLGVSLGKWSEFLFADVVGVFMAIFIVVLYFATFFRKSR